jgi:ABC-type multidrug transport system permease subunit
MSNRKPKADGEDSRPPSLAWLWGWVALALVAAIGFALLIVLPFHHRR